MKKSLLIVSAFFLITSVSTENAFGMEKKEEESKKRSTPDGTTTPSAQPEKRQKREEDAHVTDEHQGAGVNFELIGHLAQQMQEPQDPQGAAGVAVCAPASEDKKSSIECEVCMESFIYSDENCAVLRMPCCGYQICKTCIKSLIEHKTEKCPHCQRPTDLNSLKNPADLEKYKLLYKQAHQNREIERINYSINQFLSLREITAYREIPGDTEIEYYVRPEDTDQIIKIKVPILHYLLMEMEKLVRDEELLYVIKHFVEIKHADINQKALFIIGGVWPAGTVWPETIYTPISLETFLLSHTIKSRCLKHLTPLEIAEQYTDKKATTEYLRSKISEEQSPEVQRAIAKQKAILESLQRVNAELENAKKIAAERVAAERKAPPKKCTIQ
ncbi:MAG: hypothetical protein V1646_01345 [bacterium]